MNNQNEILEQVPVCSFNWSHPDVFSLSIMRVSSVKTQLIYCQLNWRHVSTRRVIIRPGIEPCLRYISKSA